MATCGVGVASKPGDFGEDEPTIAQDAFDAVTPVDLPRCAECGSAVFHDDFDDMALALGLDHCVRSKPGSERPWFWCAQYSPTHRKLVQFVPR